MIYIDVKNGAGLMRSVMDYCAFYNITNIEEKEMIYQLVREAFPPEKSHASS